MSMSGGKRKRIRYVKNKFKVARANKGSDGEGEAKDSSGIEFKDGEDGKKIMEVGGHKMCHKSEGENDVGDCDDGKGNVNGGGWDVAELKKGIVLKSKDIDGNELCVTKEKGGEIKLEGCKGPGYEHQKFEMSDYVPGGNDGEGFDEFETLEAIEEDEDDSSLTEEENEKRKAQKKQENADRKAAQEEAEKNRGNDPQGQDHNGGDQGSGDKNGPNGGDKNGPNGGGQNGPNDGGQSGPNGGQNGPNGGGLSGPNGGGLSGPNGGGQSGPNGGQNGPNGGGQSGPNGGSQNGPNGGKNGPNGGQNGPNGGGQSGPNGKQPGGPQDSNLNGPNGSNSFKPGGPQNNNQPPTQPQLQAPDAPINPDKLAEPPNLNPAQKVIFETLKHNLKAMDTNLKKFLQSPDLQINTKVGDVTPEQIKNAGPVKLADKPKICCVNSNGCRYELRKVCNTRPICC
ncbi:hypothetical protein M153_6900027742 [Pseudoloma neurophilia]|uniref:Uncharacterized protein n=1 Tax=Pseudoloma neurophilia TaxID=146866 RepID=A0A0R0M7X2_9MICR|nr:hypothetical protein M153_6900027742 [Pseudoloma neurophilia]